MEELLPQSAFHPLPPPRERSSLREHRLIWKTESPEAASEKKEKSPEAKENPKESEKKERNKAEKKVEKETDKTKEDVKKVVEEPATEEKSPMNNDEHSWTDSLERPSPPNWSALKKATLLGGAVAAPMAVIPAAAGFTVGKKVWGVMAKVPPFSWVDHGVRGGLSVVKEGIKAVGTTVAYPFVEAYKQAKNAVKITARIGHGVLEKVLLEPYREITNKLKGPNAEFAEGEEKGLNPITVLYAVAKWPFSTAKNFAIKYAHQIITHPARTIIGTAVALPILYSIIQNPMGIVGAGKDFFDVMMSILKGVASKLGSTPPAP